MLTLTLCGGLWSASCGVQGPPVPPRVERPEPVKDLRVSQIGGRFQLTFSLPQLATDGERLSKPLEIRIFRTVEPSGQKAAGASTEPPWKVLDPQEVEHLARGGRLVHAVPLSPQEQTEWKGATFQFTVITLTRGFRRRPVESGPSNLAKAVLLDVPGPVENLRAVPTEKAVELSWSRPAHGPDREATPAPSGYRLYRSRNGEPGTYQLLGETASTNYADTDFEWDRPLFYKVRAIVRVKDEAGESEDSLVAQTTPRDIFPPAIPAGLSGIFTGEGVQLIWTANVEADLAGYNVYRRETNGTQEKINRELLVTPVFRDSSVQAGQTYGYRVTAVDLKGNESAPSGEFRVEAR